MATEKLSPRQKMINMMYLVLLALLAINVSAEVLTAFETIRGKLRASAEVADQYGTDYIRSLQAEIDHEFNNLNKKDNLGLKDTLDHLHAFTSRTVRLLDGHIKEMETIAKWDPEEGTFTQKDELEDNFQYWMGEDEEAADGRGNGAAVPLRDSLDSFFGYIADLYNSQVISDSGKVNPVLTRDPARKGNGDKANTRWERHTFEGPVIGNLATLEALKMDVYQQEKFALDKLAQRLGKHRIVADKVIPVYSPMATVVPAGLPFQAKLHVALASSQLHPNYSSGSGKISLDDEGNTAVLTIPANGSVIPRGKSSGKQSYSATVSVPLANGKMETFTIRDEFEVRRPEIVVTSAAVQILYRNCGNTVNIDVPALGDHYNPVVNISNGAFRQAQTSKKKFLLMPTGRNAEVKVASKTNGQELQIGSVKYKVIRPPMPTLRWKVDGRPYNGSGLINRGSRVSVQILPDPDFAVQLPNDANYRVDKAEILLQDGFGPPRLVKTVNLRGKDPSRPIPLKLGTDVAQSRRGSTVIVRLTPINRKNFQGKLIEDRRIPEVGRMVVMKKR